jgi:hypothetical protein
MSVSRSAFAIAGICAVAFGGAYAAGTATRPPDAAKAPAPAPAAAATHARTSIADLAPAAALPGLRVDRVAAKHRATGQPAKPLAATAVAARPVRVVAPAPRPVASTPVARPAPAPSTPAPTVHRQSTETPSVAFFDDGG